MPASCISLAPFYAVCAWSFNLIFISPVNGVAFAIDIKQHHARGYEEGRRKRQDVGQICILEYAEGGPVLVLPDGRTQWSYEVCSPPAKERLLGLIPCTGAW
jgi:hypothetical protein